MNPDFFLDEFSEADSDSFLVHWEGNNNVHRTVQRVKSLGKRVGIGINPATPAAVLEAILQDVDQVLVMTVNPSFEHQHFINTTLPKLRRVREMIEKVKPGMSVRSMAVSTRGPRRSWSMPGRTSWWPVQQSSALKKYHSGDAANPPRRIENEDIKH